jgi:DNA-binding transcriptional MerR regulator
MRQGGKSAAAFRTISEVSEHLDVPQHVLRFWETKFNQVKPMKRGGGRRYYRPEDVELLRRIRKLLYNDGYTIKGVQKLLREGAVKADTPLRQTPSLPSRSGMQKDSDQGLSARQRAEIGAVVDELRTLSKMLKDAVD